MRLGILAALTCASALVGCAPASAQEYQLVTGAARVNANWYVDCTTDPVSRIRHCFAVTYGRAMSSTGEADSLGVGGAQFQVYFVNKRGPFLRVGTHTYPGQRPAIRIDNDAAPTIIHDDAGVTPVGAEPRVVRRLLTAEVVRARYYTWPDGYYNMIIDLTGFAEAWAKLQQLLAGAVAPSDTLSPTRQ